MKISENFTEILCIGDRQHETDRRKFDEAIFWKIRPNPKTSIDLPWVTTGLTAYLINNMH